MNAELTKRSKFLSLVLRHQPERIGIILDSAGWVPVDELLAGCNRHGMPLIRAELEEIVRTSDKQRFAFDEGKERIRANQGHSVAVDLELRPVSPPELLFHGTVEKFLPSIQQHGLLKGDRHHVHLSADRETAARVGQRRGKAVILTIRAAEMHKAGYVFYQSENGVWLTEHVPTQFLA